MAKKWLESSFWKAPPSCNKGKPNKDTKHDDGVWTQGEIVSRIALNVNDFDFIYWCLITFVAPILRVTMFHMQSIKNKHLNETMCIVKGLLIP